MNQGEAFEKPRVGRVGYINCLPIFYPLEKNLIKLSAQIVAEHPSNLNKLLAAGELEVTAVSSIAYARQHKSCVVLPELGIASDGAVWSVALLSRVPLSQLKGESISLTPYSATSITLLQILLNQFYRVKVEYFYRPWGTQPWWGNPTATLVIGDEALRSIYHHLRKMDHSARKSCLIYDLGTEWKRFTGKQMVFAVWVVRRDFMEPFIPWTYQPGNTDLGGKATSSWDYLRMIAVSRIYLDNIPNLQVSWVTQGVRIAQIALAFGANDFGSTMLEENVVRAAGTCYSSSKQELVDLIKNAGFKPAQRDNLYNILRYY